VKGETVTFADQGYVALAVDLYRGKVTNDPMEAHELKRGLPEDRAVSDLKAAFDYLAARKHVKPGGLALWAGAWAADIRCNWRSTSRGWRPAW
jgi:dienelactone hydrolase